MRASECEHLNASFGGLTSHNTQMKYICALLCLLFAAPIFAANATINWVAPAAAVDGSALTGAQALTNYQVWVSTSSIASTTTTAPTATLTSTNTTTTQTIAASAGAKIYARVKACIGLLCSDFSAEATATVPVSAPGIPTSVTITITAGP